MATIWRQMARRAEAQDRPLITSINDGVRLELIGRDGGLWAIELTRADCEAIAEAIGWDPPGRWPARTTEE
jgi:hypothetical protein